MKVMLTVIDFLGPGVLKWFIGLKAISTILPLNTAFMLANSFMKWKLLAATQALAIVEGEEAAAVTATAFAWTAKWTAATMGIGGIIILIAGWNKLGGALTILIGILLAAAAAFMIYWGAMTLGVAVPIILAATALGVAGLYKMSQEAQASNAAFNASWGTTGGIGSHTGLAIGGTTSIGGMTDIAGGAIPGAGMTAGAGGSSITNIEIHGDVYDKEGFETVLAEGLPGATQKMSDTGRLDRYADVG